MRRFFSLIGVLALVTAACSSTPADTSSTTTTTFVAATTTPTSTPATIVIEPTLTAESLEVWVPTSALGAVEDAAAAFEIDTGIPVEVTVVEFEDLMTRLLEDPSAGPDVFFGPHAWLTDLTKAGVAEPLTPRSDVVGGAAAAVALRGFSYAAPMGLDTVAEFRNTALLVSAPATVESFASGCTVRGTKTACLLLPSTSVEGHWPFITGLGGYLFGPDEYAGWNKDDVGLDTPEAIASGLVLDTILDGSGILGDGSTTALERFVAGEAPLLWGTLTDLAALRETDLDFTVDQLPTIGDQPSPVPVIVTAAWVNAFSADKEAATVLVEGYLAVPDSARSIAVAMGLAPVDIDFSGNADLVPFTEGAKVGQPVPPIPATEFAWQELAIAFDAIRNGQSAEDAFRGAASSIRAES